MNEKGTARNAAFDQIKGLMLFLVAFGHVVDCFKDRGRLEWTLLEYVLSVSMPMFAFVTGYFSKDAERARKHALTRALAPYLIFQTLYVLSAQILISRGIANFNADIFRPSLLMPTSAFYYLLCVYAWKVMLPDLVRLRWPIFTSTVLALTVSLTDQTLFHIGWGAVFTLLPFFVLGVKCDAATIGRLQRLSPLFGALVLAIGFAVAYFVADPAINPYSMHNIRRTYASFGLSPAYGMALRLAFYLVVVLMGAAIINLVTPARRISAFTRIGEGSILAYAGSTFLSPHAYLLVAPRLGLTTNRYLNIAGMLVFSFAVVFACSHPILVCLYKRLQSALERLLLRRDAPAA